LELTGGREGGDLSHFGGEFRGGGTDEFGNKKINFEKK
jgi:hypothetical protein